MSSAHAESLHLIADGGGNAAAFVLNREPGDESPAIARSEPLKLRSTPAPGRAADIALALSGGGARAIAFHLGVMRALNDRGWLERIGSISAASGGAVIAALYAYRDEPFEDFDRRVVHVLRNGITPRIFREALRPRHRWKAALGLWSSGRALVGEAARAAIGVAAAMGAIDRRRSAGWAAALSAPRRAHTRTDAFAAALTDIVGAGAMPDVARPDLGVVISATDLRTGTAFRFGSRESGLRRLGRLRSGPPLVAEAVAASAAYPTLLPALDREYDFERNGGTQRCRVALSDGGLYDNAAASALDPDRDPNVSIQTSPARILIASDAGPGAGARAAPVPLAGSRGVGGPYNAQTRARPRAWEALRACAHRPPGRPRDRLPRDLRRSRPGRTAGPGAPRVGGRLPHGFLAHVGRGPRDAHEAGRAGGSRAGRALPPRLRVEAVGCAGKAIHHAALDL